MFMLFISKSGLWSGPDCSPLSTRQWEGGMEAALAGCCVQAMHGAPGDKSTVTPAPLYFQKALYFQWEALVLHAMPASMQWLAKVKVVLRAPLFADQTDIFWTKSREDLALFLPHHKAISGINSPTLFESMLHYILWG